MIYHFRSMTLRARLLALHRWVGVGSAAIIVVMGVTGAMLVWPGESLARRTAEVLHDSLALSRLGLGRAGWLIIMAATAAAVFLQVTGLVLWWKRKIVRIETAKGWRRLMFDLHHSIGAVFLLVMLVVAGTGLARAGLRYLDRPPTFPALHTAVSRLHTTKDLGGPVKAVLFAGSVGLAVQGISGLVIWWPSARTAARVRPRVTPDGSRS